jgi:hypothetical protein
MPSTIILPQLNHTIGTINGANGEVFVQLKHLFTNSRIPDTSHIQQPNLVSDSFVGDVILTNDGMYPFIPISEDEEANLMLDYFNKDIWKQMTGMKEKKSDCFGWFTVIYFNTKYPTWDSEKWKKITFKLIENNKFD